MRASGYDGPTRICDPAARGSQRRHLGGIKCEKDPLAAGTSGRSPDIAAATVHVIAAATTTTTTTAAAATTTTTIGNDKIGVGGKSFRK